MFYEKLAQAKEEKKRRDGLIGAGSLALSAGLLGGERKLEADTRSPLTDREANASRRAHFASALTTYLPEEMSDESRSQGPWSWDGAGQKKTYDEHLADLPEDVREAFLSKTDVPAYDHLLESYYRRVEDHANELLDRPYKRYKRHQAPLLLGAGLTGAYGVKKLYDHYNQRKRREG